MPRKRRIDYPGAWHHVMHRGARREPIFRREEHCVWFLSYLAKVVQCCGLEVHAYALMPNHYHLLVRSVEGDLAECMRRLNGPYTQWLNRRYGWDGPVFRGRYRAQMVNDSEHLCVLVPYIHLNPVRARLVAVPEQASWTSCTVYTGLSSRPEWLRTDVILSLFETPENLSAETDGLRTGQLDWPKDFDLRRGMFKTWSPDIPRTAEQKARRRKADVDRVKSLVWEVADCPWRTVLERRRGRRGNPARLLAVWFLSRNGRLSHREVGEVLGMTGAHVGVILDRLTRQETDSQVQIWIRKYCDRVKMNPESDGKC